jgi:membrane protein involved in colicin uptake
MEMEKRMLQMLEPLLARQEKADADAKVRQEKADADAKARQEKADADAKARQEKADADAEARHERFLAILDGWKSYGKGTTTCQIETTSCPEEMKDTIKMEINPEDTQAAVECQELQMEEADVWRL